MVLNENDMYNIIFKTIQQKPGELTAMTLMRNACQAITDKVEGNIDTQEICDDVLNCFDYYNDFISCHYRYIYSNSIYTRYYIKTLYRRKYK